MTGTLSNYTQLHTYAIIVISEYTNNMSTPSESDQSTHILSESDQSTHIPWESD